MVIKASSEGHSLKRMVLPMMLVGPIIKWVVIGIIALLAIIFLFWIVGKFTSKGDDTKSGYAKGGSARAKLPWYNPRALWT